MVYLQDTELRAELHHQNHDVVEIEITDAFDTGFWKHVSISKRGSALTLTLDRTKSVTIAVPKRIHLNKHVWIGGIGSGGVGSNLQLVWQNQLCLKY